MSYPGGSSGIDLDQSGFYSSSQQAGYAGGNDAGYGYYQPNQQQQFNDYSGQIASPTGNLQGQVGVSKHTSFDDEPPLLEGVM